MNDKTTDCSQLERGVIDFIYQYYRSCSEVHIETLPADQQEPARKEWEKVLRPFKRREPWL